ncbi:SLATT domain-containing protein [Phormidium tenue FACHB-886]|nr:SLATT domain-containing protein [Phormidium tenue FACHB-886]
MEENELLIKWLKRSHIVLAAHHHASAVLQRRRYWLGVSVIILTSFVGTSIFATLEGSPSLPIKIAVGFASFVATTLASLQTFLWYEERAERHRSAGIKYGVIMRELEQKAAFPPKDEDELLRSINDIRIRWDRLNEESPIIPGAI